VAVAVAAGVVAVVPLQASAAEELPPLLQILLRPVHRAVVPHLAAPVRRVDHPAAEVAVADLETFALPIFRTPRVGLAALSLPWQCEVDKAR
jgi:hypothetical protein